MCCCFSNSSKRLLRKRKETLVDNQKSNPSSKKATSSCHRRLRITSRQSNKEKSMTTATTTITPPPKKYIFVHNLPEKTESELILRFFNEMIVRQKGATKYLYNMNPPVRNCIVVGRSAYMTMANTRIAHEAQALNGKIEYLGHTLSIGIILPRQRR